jgi:hypothetical protein
MKFKFLLLAIVLISCSNTTIINNYIVQPYPTIAIEPDTNPGIEITSIIQTLPEESKEIVYEYYIPKKYKDFVIKITKENEVPIWLFARQIKEESNWDYKAINENKNDKGEIISYDYGLGQLNSRYLDEYVWKFNDNKPLDPFDPETNLYVACKILKWAYNLTNSWEDAIMIYNCGYTKWTNNNIPIKTILYKNRIFKEPTIEREKNNELTS